MTGLQIPSRGIFVLVLQVLAVRTLSVDERVNLQVYHILNGVRLTLHNFVELGIHFLCEYILKVAFHTRFVRRKCV